MGATGAPLPAAAGAGGADGRRCASNRGGRRAPFGRAAESPAHRAGRRASCARPAPRRATGCTRCRAPSPPKPGMVRVDDAAPPSSSRSGRSTPGAFGRFVARVPPPLCIGTIELDDGSARQRLPVRTARAGGRHRHLALRRLAAVSALAELAAPSRQPGCAHSALHTVAATSCRYRIPTRPPKRSLASRSIPAEALSTSIIAQSSCPRLIPVGRTSAAPNEQYSRLELCRAVGVPWQAPRRGPLPQVGSRLAERALACHGSGSAGRTVRPALFESDHRSIKLREFPRNLHAVRPTTCRPDDAASPTTQAASLAHPRDLGRQARGRRTQAERQSTGAAAQTTRCT